MDTRAPQERPKIGSRLPVSSPFRPGTPNASAVLRFAKFVRKTRAQFIFWGMFFFFCLTFCFGPVSSRHPRSPKEHPGSPPKRPRTPQGPPRRPPGATTTPRASKKPPGTPKELPRSPQGPSKDDPGVPNNPQEPQKCTPKVQQSLRRPPREHPRAPKE